MSPFTPRLALAPVLSLLAACAAARAGAGPSSAAATSGAQVSTPRPSSAAAAEPSSRPADAFERGLDPGPIALAENAAGGALPMVAPPPASPRSEARSSDIVLTDGDIVAVVAAASSAERALAAAGIRRAKDGRIRQLAQLAATDQVSGPLARIARSAALTPRTPPASVEIVAAGARLAAGIESASDPEFDRVFLAALEAQERRLIRLIDDELIPQVQDGELRTFLVELRSSVAGRLAMAENVSPVFRR